MEARALLSKEYHKNPDTTSLDVSVLPAHALAACGTSPLDNYAEDFSFAGPSLFSRELKGKRSRYRWVHRRIVCADEITARGLAR